MTDTTTDARPHMPLDSMAALLVQDPSESIYGPDYHGREFSGTGGGTLDADSGVLELEFTPYAGKQNGDFPQEYAPTTVRFVEVEKMLDALATLIDGMTDRESWRAVLAEKLDASDL